MAIRIHIETPFTQPYHYEDNSVFSDKRGLQVLDYTPFLSMISGIFHLTLGSLALTVLPLSILADLTTFGFFDFTERVVTVSTKKIVRGTLCFMPFIGNLIIYQMDQAENRYQRANF